MKYGQSILAQSDLGTIKQLDITSSLQEIWVQKRNKLNDNTKKQDKSRTGATVARL